MKLEGNKHETSEKPPVLFHASRNPYIEVFEPRAEKTRDKTEGPRVFGTPSRAMASVFLIEWDDSWVQAGIMDGEPYIIISDEDRFRAADTGSVIYSLPSETFENDPLKGLRELEWTSREPVIPTEKENITSALSDMLKQRVKVYFVTKELFEKILTAPNDGEALVKSLVPYQELEG